MTIRLLYRLWVYGISFLTFCMLGNISIFFSSACRFLQYHCLHKIISGIPSEFQTVRAWIQIRPDVLPGLIWVQLFVKGCQQTKLACKELRNLTCFFSQSSWTSRYAKFLSLSCFLNAFINLHDKTFFYTVDQIADTIIYPISRFGLIINLTSSLTTDKAVMDLLLTELRLDILFKNTHYVQKTYPYGWVYLDVYLFLFVLRCYTSHCNKRLLTY